MKLPDCVNYIFVQVNKTHGVNLFYWLIESRNDPALDPLVVWLTGGPGCSSMLALLGENGPFLIPEGKHNLIYNKYGTAIYKISWLAFALGWP